MKVQKILPGTAGWRQLRAIYETAFPEAERRPLTRLWLLSCLRRSVTLQGWSEDGTLCGFALYVTGSRYLYLAYIAVAEDRRSSGLGSRILSELRAREPEKTMLVEIEDPMVPSDNQNQRRRRACFYERNGFQALDRTITGRGVRYRLYATAPDYDREAYFAALRQLSFRRRA